MPETEIVVYGTTWCYDSKRARKLMDDHNILYRFIDIDKDPQARKFVEETNNGFRSVPTIIFPDESILVEPSNRELAQKLGIL